MPPADWPNRDASRRVRAGGFEWHVQVAGSGPDLLLLHGTGAATHSWRDVLPLLAARFRVVAPDLPGHGFTETPARARMTIEGMGAAVHALTTALDVSPALICGHSAGVAVAIRMVLEGRAAPRGLVGLNAALLPMGGIPGQLFSPVARLLAGLPILPLLFARRSRDPGVVRRLLEGTGSRIDAKGADLYGRLFREPRHAAAALEMMARWDLQALSGDIPRLCVPLLLVVGEGDRTVPPEQSVRVAAMVADGALERLPGLGHLTHEEAPEVVATLIVEFARRLGVLA